MTPDERRAMQDVLRSALQRAVLPGATPHPPGGHARTDPIPSDLTARFTTELTTLGGSVVDLPGATTAAVAAAIATLAATGERAPVLMWDDRWLPVPGLADALTAVGFTIERQLATDVGDAACRARLATCGFGITSADACLAETGSLVLVSGEGRGRLASLLPPVHIAIVDRSRMMRSLPDLLLSRPELATAGSNLVCITGPSRTADIEHTLSRGVHGPREVHVILVG